MLSAKYVKIHGMKEDSWTIRDKMNQYRGILKLHARERKVRIVEAAKLKKRVSKDLKSLVEDVKEYREIVKDVETGDKRRMHTVLQEHRDFQLAYENLEPNAILDGAFQDSSLKRRQLDKLYYQKKKKMKEFFDLKLECAILSDKYEREQECPPNYVQQRLITGYQQSRAKQNAAKSIRATYRAMLKILEKDSIYFDAVLDTLKEDRQGQCKVLLRATVMGQLGAENLDDTRQRYKQLANEVWINMKERERTLNIVRAQVEDLWAYARSLVRAESDTNFAGKTIEKETGDEDTVDRQIRQLEDTFDRVKDSLAVRSYEELFSRLEAQMKQKSRLLKQFNENFKKRDALLNSKNHALLVLATLEHSMVTTTGQYKTDKKAMLEEIETQKKREFDYKNVRKARGELLVDIRAALQNMLVMLICVKETTLTKVMRKGAKETMEKKVLKEKTKDQKDEEKVTDEKSLHEGTQISLKVESDALALMTQVRLKVTSLFSMNNIGPDPDDEKKARDIYQRYISDYRSKIKYGQDEPEPTVSPEWQNIPKELYLVQVVGIFVEHEVIDSSVLTRADVKLRSRQLVEAKLKPE